MTLEFRSAITHTLSHTYSLVRPRNSRGGPIAAVQDGDTIVIDVAARTLNLAVDAAVLTERLAAWRAPQPRYPTGVMAKYARMVSSASLGAVTG